MASLKSILTGIGFIFLLFLTVSYAAPPGVVPITAASPISDSMQPTISQDEIVILSSGSPTEGDVILFESEEHTNNVLHRVVEEEDDGSYITQGDANDVTDQRDGLDPVDEDQIYGSVITIGSDNYLSIPIIGAILTSPASLLSLWVLISIWAFAPSILRTVGTNPTRRPDYVGNTPGRGTVIAIGLAILIIIPILAIGTATTVNASIITSTTASEEEEGNRVAAIEEKHTKTIEVESTSLVGMTHVVTKEGNLTHNKTQSDALSTDTQVNLTNTPRAEPGSESADLTFYTFPATLPNDTLTRLAQIHPALAGLASGGVIAVTLTLLALLLIDRKTILRGSRNQIKRLRRERP